MLLSPACSHVPSLQKMCILLLTATAVTLPSFCSAADDIFMQFYMDQVKQWEQQGQQAKLQSAMLPGLRAYCSKAANFPACGINSTADTNYTALSVILSPGYPVNSRGRYLNVRFKISYSVGSTFVTLPAAAVSEIAQNQRDAISAEVGYYVVYINDALFSVPPPAMANKVIVPMFVIGTFLLVAVALSMREYHSKRQKKQLRKYGLELKSSGKGNKVGASAADLATTDEAAAAGKDKNKSTIDGNAKKKKKKTKKKAGGGIDWGGADKGGKKQLANKAGEFNNVGFDKSMNDGDGGGGGGGDSSSGDPRASQSALSEVIQVRGDAPKKSKKTGIAEKARSHHASGGGDGGAADKAKKSLASSRKQDSEEAMLMDAGVFNPPEVNVPVPHSLGDEGDSEGDSSDQVPTLRDASVQQMI